MNKIAKILLIAVMAFVGTKISAQDISNMTSAQFKALVDSNDGVGFFDRLGVQMTIGGKDELEQMFKLGSSDGAVYEILQGCQRLYKGLPYVPQFVVDYYLSHFEQYQKYYATTLSKTGDVNDAAAAFILLTAFNSKCKAIDKSYRAFSDLCRNFTVDAAYAIVSDDGKNNAYRGATLLYLSSELLKMSQSGTLSNISPKVKKGLLKVYDSVVKECDKALKQDNPAYNQYVSQYKDMYEYLLNKLG